MRMPKVGAQGTELSHIINKNINNISIAKKRKNMWEEEEKKSKHNFEA